MSGEDGAGDDPRASLAAGLYDAEQAILNMDLVGTLQRPAGFFDPANPGGIPPKPPKEEPDDETEAQEEEEG